MSIPAPVLAWIKRIEGGLVDDPRDSGGATYVGLTAPALVGIDENGDGRKDFDLDGDGDVDADDIRLLAKLPRVESDAKVAAFYNRTWTRVGFGLPWPASLLAFDAAVHHGPRPGIMLLQRALSVTADGLIGGITLRAARFATAPDLARAYQAERNDLFRRICNRRAKDRAFLLGWLNRVALLRQEVMRGVGA